MNEPTFEIVSNFIFPTGKKAREISITHKIQICETIQMGNISLVEDPNVKLTGSDIMELIVCERLYLN